MGSDRVCSFEDELVSGAAWDGNDVGSFGPWGEPIAGVSISRFLVLNQKLLIHGRGSYLLVGGREIISLTRDSTAPYRSTIPRRSMDQSY